MKDGTKRLGLRFPIERKKAHSAPGLVGGKPLEDQMARMTAAQRAQAECSSPSEDARHMAFMAQVWEIEKKFEEFQKQNPKASFEDFKKSREGK